jgi:integrase/recombinase XerD
MVGGINSESAPRHAGLSTTQIYTQVSVHQLKAIHTATHPGKPIGKWGTHSGETADETLTAESVLAALDAETQEEA